MTNRTELRRLAEAAPESIQDDYLGMLRADMHRKLTPTTVLSLLDELDAKDNTLLALTTRHFAESWSRRSTDAKLDEYLSAGIAQLQEERDAALAELESLRIQVGTLTEWYSNALDLIREVTAAIPGVTYMDPPDGGDVSIQEQIRRMAKDAERYRFVIDRGVLNESAIDEFMRLNSEAMSQEAPNA